MLLLLSASTATSVIQLHGIALDLDEAYVVMERGVENLSQKIQREVDIYMASLERRFVSFLVYIYYRQDTTRQDKTYKTRQDKTRQDKTRQDKTRQDKTR